MPTWTDIEERALNCPFLYRAVMAVKTGQATREEALMSVALSLSEVRETMTKHEVDRLRNSPVAYFMDRQNW